MPAGIEAYTMAGQLQFDATTFVMCFQYKATVTANTTYYGFGFVTDVVVTSARTPVLAIASTTTQFCILKTTKSGSTWTFKVFVYGGDYTFTYYVFDTPNITASNSSGCGFEVYNASGGLVWTSDQPPMNLRGVSPQPVGPTYAALYTGVISYTEDTTVYTDFSAYTTWYYYITVTQGDVSGGDFRYLEYTQVLYNGGNSGFSGPGNNYSGDGNGFSNGQPLMINVTNL